MNSSLLSDELRLAIEKDGGSPVHLVGTTTDESYVIMRAEVYERLRVLGDDFDIRDAYPLMDQVAARQGWDDPAMDIYNEYQPPSE